MYSADRLRWARRWLLVLDQRVEIVRLRKQHARIGLERAHHIRHRPAIRNPQPQQRGAVELEVEGFEVGQSKTLHQRADLLARHRACNFDDDFFRLVALFAGRRNSARVARCLLRGAGSGFFGFLAFLRHRRQLRRRFGLGVGLRGLAGSGALLLVARRLRRILDRIADD